MEQQNNTPETTLETLPTHSRFHQFVFTLGWQWACLIAVLGFAVIWVLLSLFYSHVQIGNKRLNATSSDMAYLSAINEQMGGYKVVITYPDNSAKSYAIKDVGLSIDGTTTLSRLHIMRNDISNRLTWWKPMHLTLSLAEDPRGFAGFIANRATIIKQPSADATLTFVKGVPTISEATLGKQYGLENPWLQLQEHVSDLDTSVIKLKELSLQPKITTKQLVSSKKALETIINQPVSFTIGTQKIIPTIEEKAEWLELTPDKTGRKVAIVVNSGKVQAYIDAIAIKYVRKPKSQVTITNADGSNTVVVAGQTGVEIANKDAAASDVAAHLLDKKGIAVSLPVQYAQFTTITAADYPKWIEVDVVNKRLYAYEHATLARTFLISAGAPATPTVLGQYAVYSKLSSQDMRGQNVDGSNYFQPRVPWVNYFYKDYAIHGNYWRPTSYFGNINSSHGCVSTVPDDAEWIYDWAPVGTPVIVHK